MDLNDTYNAVWDLTDLTDSLGGATVRTHDKAGLLKTLNYGDCAFN